MHMTAYGVRRGLFTLLGAASALFLVWVATLPDRSTTGGYWAAYGIIAGAGLALPVSQLLGGWTKGGWPRISAGVFLLGFLPAFVVVPWILLATQPPGGWERGRLIGWTNDIGVWHFVSGIDPFKAALAFSFGALLGLTLDTSGPRVVPASATVADYEPAVADEPVTAERQAEVVEPRV
jgi:hypothetical protein